MFAKKCILFLKILTLVSCFKCEGKLIRYIFKTDSYIFKVDERNRMFIFDIDNKVIDSVDVFSNHYYSPDNVNDRIYFVSPTGNIIEHSLSEGKGDVFLKGLNKISYIKYIKAKNALLVIYEKGKEIRLYSLDSKELIFEISSSDQFCTLPIKNSYDIVIDSSNFIIADWRCDNISVYNLTSCNKVWATNEKKGSSCLVDLEDKIMIATNEFYGGGFIEIRHKKNGELLFKREINVQDRMKPVQNDRDIYIYCYDGKLISINKVSFQVETIKLFKNTNEMWDGSQMKLIGNKIIAQNLNYERVSFDLETKETEFIEKAKKGGYIDVNINSQTGKFQFLEFD